MAAMHNVALFIVNFFFSLCIFVVLLRIFLQFFRANSSNPICQMTAKMTNPIVLPLRKMLPRLNFIDLSSVLLLFFIEIMKFIILALLQGVSIGILLILLLSFTDMLLQVIDLFFYAIIIRVLLSWFNSPNTMILAEIVYMLSEPILAPIRRRLPPMNGFDLSPILAFVLLNIMSIIIRSYLPG
jgi:YggT family protein